VLTLFCEGFCWKSGLEIELEGVLLSLEANGFIKELKAPGLVGLRGPSSKPSGESGGNCGFIVICQSYILYRSSGTVRNKSVVPHGSFDVSAPVLLDLRFRCFSAAASGFISSINVGRDGPCFRCWRDRISHDLNADIGCCARNSQSPCYQN
jgi:hypothetical protein